MRKPSEAEILQISAIAVAAPRYMGAFASAIGISIVQAWPWFITVEIATGFAMAVLEGWAIAFIMRRIRATRAKTASKVLWGLWIALIITLPLVAMPYLLSMQYELAVIAFLPWYAVALWSFLVAAVAPLVVAAVGYADVQRIDKAESKPKASQTSTEPSTEQGKLVAQAIFVCSCGNKYDTYQGLNAHKRFCKNGAHETITE